MEKFIHVLGIDPGGTTGWCRLTIPRASMFGEEPSSISEWDHGCFYGAEVAQVRSLLQLCREIQGLAYKIGPAMVCEDWDVDPSFKTTDPEALSPVRIGAMLKYGVFRGEAGEATLMYQGRTTAKNSAATTDDRLRRLGMYAPSDHERDATRHAIMALRRAKQDTSLAAQMWPAAAAYRVRA